MSKELNYQSPECVLFMVRTEGVLCSSADGFGTTSTSTETFEKLNEFNW